MHSIAEKHLPDTFPRYHFGEWMAFMLERMYSPKMLRTEIILQCIRFHQLRVTNDGGICFHWPDGDAGHDEVA